MLRFYRKVENTRTQAKLDLLLELYNNTRALTKASALNNQKGFEALMARIIEDDMYAGENEKQLIEAMKLCKEQSEELVRLKKIIKEEDKIFNYTENGEDYHVAAHVISLNKHHTCYNRSANAIVYDKKGEPLKAKWIR